MKYPCLEISVSLCLYIILTFFQIAAKINQPGQGGGDGMPPGKRPLDTDPNNFGEYQSFLIWVST